MSTKSRTTEGSEPDGSDCLRRRLPSKRDNALYVGTLSAASSSITASKEPDTNASGVYRRLTGETSGETKGRGVLPREEEEGARPACFLPIWATHCWISVSDSGSVAEPSPKVEGTTIEPSRDKAFEGEHDRAHERR